MISEKNKRIIITLPKELVEGLEEICKSTGKTKSELIFMLVNTLVG